MVGFLLFFQEQTVQIFKNCMSYPLSFIKLLFTHKIARVGFSFLQQNNSNCIVTHSHSCFMTQFFEKAFGLHLGQMQGSFKVI